MRFPRERRGGGFRLAIDRNFNLKGAGLVVTGTVFAGETRPGDQLMVSPSGHEVRVRGIHAQNLESDTGAAGQRCALNLTGRGISRDSISRGDWLVAPALNSPTRRFDARLKVLASENRALRHWTPVHVHSGAVALTGRVALLGDRPIPPGEAALVQVVVDTPTSVTFGDRFVIRDQSARRTIGGGRVIDPFAPGRGRRAPARLALLRATDHEDLGTALQAMCEAAPGGIDLARFAVARNVTPPETTTAAGNAGLIITTTSNSEIAITPGHWDQLRSTIVEEITKHHVGASDSPGMSLRELKTASGVTAGMPLFAAAVADLVASGKLVQEGGVIRQADHQAALPPRDAALWHKVSVVLEADDGRPPSVPDLADSLGMNVRDLERFLVKLGRQGLTVQVSRNRFMTPSMVRRLAGTAEQLAAEAAAQKFTVRMFRDATALGRNLTIEVLEFFDRSGFTRRVGDERMVLKPVADAFKHLSA